MRYLSTLLDPVRYWIDSSLIVAEVIQIVDSNRINEITINSIIYLRFLN